jgi:predicted protein tyrosine phosphatase
MPCYVMEQTTQQKIQEDYEESLAHLKELEKLDLSNDATFKEQMLLMLQRIADALEKVAEEEQFPK